MCGIGGVYLRSRDGQEQLDLVLRRMNFQQRHRGPDGQGTWSDNAAGIGLAHVRLAILGLSDAGAQPMLSPDARYVVTYNGEIYNWRELRGQLEKQGCVFKSETDTEVLLEGYRVWGESVLHKMRGMFSFAIYDRVERSLFCARDRVGKKPFVYAQTEKAFVFASEIPAIKQLPNVDVSYDQAAVAAMLLHNMRHIPDPHTAYRGIKRMRPGHAMVVRDGRIDRVWRYWTPTPSSDPITPERLRALFEETVNLRMQADVPVGALLSGGVDSSAIVALMQTRSSVPVHTYALGFDPADEDLRRARTMACTLGTRHREFYFNPDEQWDIFQMLIRIYGEPIMLLPLVHTYVLSRAVRDDGIKVVLTGNGADELFYGYTGHIRTLKVSRWLDRIAYARSLLAPLKSTRLGWIAAKPGARKAAWYRSIARTEWANYLTADACEHIANVAAEELAYWGNLCPSSHFIDESNFDGLMVENPHSVTIAGDLPAMAASVEFRSPFLDQEMVSFALATPAEKKIPDIRNPKWLKAILREAVHDLVPTALLKAPKRGFGMSIQEADVLRGPWRGQADKLFRSANDMDGLIDKACLMNQWQGFLAGKVPAHGIAKMLAMQVWLQIGQTNACE